MADDEAWDRACAVAGLRSERLNEVDEMIRIYQQDGPVAQAMWPIGSDERYAMSAVVVMRPRRG
jgi:hypothetical protein